MTDLTEKIDSLSYSAGTLISALALVRHWGIDSYTPVVAMKHVSEDLMALAKAIEVLKAKNDESLSEQAE